MDSPIRFRVNGEPRRVSTDPQRSLLDVLREDLHLTGTKYGCGQGQCGACTVLVDGEPVRSCQTAVGQVADRAITTIEGLARDGRLHAVQEAFLEAGALQCGYCTPGMILETVALLHRDPDPSEAAIRRGLNGHVCRCNGYARILDAVRRAARKQREVAR